MSGSHQDQTAFIQKPSNVEFKNKYVYHCKWPLCQKNGEFPFYKGGLQR